MDGKRLETAESIKDLERYMRSQIEVVRKNPDVAREYLYGTGMYDHYGQVKPEFD